MSYFLYEVIVKHTQQKLEIMTERRCIPSEHFDIKFLDRWSDFCVTPVKNALAKASKTWETQKAIDGVKERFGYAAELFERDYPPDDYYDE